MRRFLRTKLGRWMFPLAACVDDALHSCANQGKNCPTCLAASRASLYGIWIWIRSAFQVRKK